MAHVVVVKANVIASAPRMKDNKRRKKDMAIIGSNVKKPNVI